MEAEHSHPLLPAQSAVWMAQEIAPDSPWYNVGEFLEIHGPVDPALFEAALRQVTAEVEALGARFIDDGGSGRQVIGLTPQSGMTYRDLADLADPRAAALAWMQEDMARAVRLTEGPVCSQALFKAAGESFLWYQRAHHIVLDGFGFYLFRRRVADVYTSLVNGVPSEPCPFGSLAALIEESESYQSSERAADRAFWSARCKDMPEPVGLSSGAAHRQVRQTPLAAYPESHRAEKALNQGMLDLLRRSAREAGTGWPAVVVAALALYTSRLTGAEDVVLGFPVTGRSTPLSRRVPSMMSNVLPLRLRVRPDMRLDDLVGSAAREIDQVLRHQRYRGEDLRRDLGIIGSERRLYGPVVNIASFDSDIRFAGHRTTGTFLARPQSEDLSVFVYDRRDGNGLSLIYTANPELYGAQELEAHAERFTRMLHRMSAADADTPVGRFEVLPKQELEAVTAGRNETVRDDPVETFDDLFRASVNRDRDAVALVCGDERLTYGELDARVERLAQDLTARGAGPEKVVGLLLERSSQFVIGMLAVLRAGAGYLPLDPSFPVERLRFTLADAGATDCVTSRAHHGKLPPTVAAHFVEGATATGGRALSAAPGNAAYVIYTSGSTGHPKGVTVTHKSLADIARTLEAIARGSGSERVAWVTAPSFDMSLKALTTLARAGTVHIPSDEVRLDPHACVEYIRRSAITLLPCTPGYFEQLTEAGLLDRLPDAAPLNVWLGGEKVADRLWARLRRTPGIRVLNMYGPTESTVDATAGWVHDSPASVIGRPLPNRRVYVLDVCLQPVPDGVPGELYLAGSGLARGYLGRPGPTSGRFVADPFGPPGSRMYRTGDRARWDDDGRLAFLDRTDGQVKIRGYRVELGEIENVLTQHPDVAQAVVVVREDRPGAARVVAYPVLVPGGTWDPGELHGHMAARVPEHMLPSAYVHLTRLPLTTNGKVDRTALPPPSHDDTAGSGRSAVGPAEAAIRELFGSVLGLTEAQADGNFFALGGDSIMAMQLSARARRAGWIVKPQDVFRYKTAAALATVATRLDGPTDDAAAREWHQSADPGPVPLTPIMCELRERGGRIEHYSQAVVIQVPGGLDRADLAAALQVLIDRHDALRLRLVRDGGDWALSTLPCGAVRAADHVQRINVRGFDTGLVAKTVAGAHVSAAAGLDADAGVMMRCVWLDAGPEESGRLVWAIHHLAVDGVSWRILLPELAEAWRALADGRPVDLGPPGVSFRDWATRQVDGARGPARLAELPAWASLARSTYPRLTDQALDPAQDTVASAARLVLSLPSATSAALLNEAPAAFDCGMDELLMTALVLALADWRRSRGQKPCAAVMVNREGHGRDGSQGTDLSRTVGWFTIRYPVPLDAGPIDLDEARGGGQDLHCAVRRIKEQLHAVPGNGEGYGLLSLLGDAGGLPSRAPAQINVNYLGRFTASRSTDWEVASDQDPILTYADPELALTHHLEVIAVARQHERGTQLSATWLWPGRLWDRSTVQALADSWTGWLEVLAHATGPSMPGLLTLTQAEIDLLEGEWTDTP